MSELLPSDRVERLSGFGMNRFSDGYVFRPATVAQVREALEVAKASGRRITLRGAGRSYGDAAIGDESLVLDFTRMNRVLAWDPVSGILEVQPGATIETLWRTVLEDGYWPPVVSGTMFPTVAGALAMNIHGKNNFREGVFGEHVTELEVLFPQGETRILTPNDELFHSVVGSFGSLGITLRAKLQMKRVPSGDLRVLPVSAPDLDAHFRAFERYREDADYMVSWVDAFPKGARLGRGLFHAAWYTQVDSGAHATLKLEHQDLPDSILGFFPKNQVWKILRRFNSRLGMSFINGAKFRASKLLGDGRPHYQSLVEFSFLLDYVPGWQKAYRHGFAQFQGFVPEKTAPDAFRRILESAQAADWVPNLAVMKRHRADPFLLSHGLDGYSLALDFRLVLGREREFEILMHRLAEHVATAGGRFYPAKDSSLSREEYVRGVGQEALDKLRALRGTFDPSGLLTSGLIDRIA